MGVGTDLFEVRITVRSADETADIARRIGSVLGAGDTVLLRGPVGAGKSHFCRSLIQSRLAVFGVVEDVPSPTFTLVQTYHAGPVEIWHADLYRLTDPDDVLELGLEAAFDTAICLVEWPDMLADTAPQSALWLDIEATDTPGTRHLNFRGPNGRWQHLLDEVLHNA